MSLLLRIVDPKLACWQLPALGCVDTVLWYVTIAQVINTANFLQGSFGGILHLKGSLLIVSRLRRHLNQLFCRGCVLLLLIFLLTFLGFVARVGLEGLYEARCCPYGDCLPSLTHLLS